MTLSFDRQTSALMIRALTAISLTISAFVALPTRANDDVFVVPRIFVSAQAESAIAAKQEAVIAGRREAMDILLRRVTPESDWGYLPRLKQGQDAPIGVQEPPLGDVVPTASGQFGGPTAPRFGKTAITLDDQGLQALEQSFEVYEEKSSPTTYRAFITYRFKPVETRNLLISAQIPYSEAQTRMALVLPVLQTDNGLYLWESNNPWLRAWQNKPLDSELTPMTAPLADLEDTSSVTARQALNLDQEKLAILAQRYGVPQVIVAHARLSQQDGQDRLRVRLINGYRESGALSAESDAYTSSEILDGLGQATRDEYARSQRSLTSGAISADGTIAGEPGDILSEVYLNATSGNFPTLATDGISAAVKKYSTGWKSQTLIDHSISTTLRASAFFASISEWKKIRSALISTPLVGSVQVQNLSPAGASLTIQAFGDPGKLVVAMEAQGLSLWTFHQGVIEEAVWNIATPATAARIPAHVQRAPLQQRRVPRARRGLFGENQLYNDGTYPPADRQDFQTTNGDPTFTPQPVDRDDDYDRDYDRTNNYTPSQP